MPIEFALEVNGEMLNGKLSSKRARKIEMAGGTKSYI
jgi:hypothetical protein